MNLATIEAMNLEKYENLKIYIKMSKIIFRNL